MFRKNSLQIGALIILILIVMSLVLLPLPPKIPATDITGVYNALSELMWCTDEDSCVHELMHHMDDELGWPSRSDKFAKTMQIYLLVEIQNGDQKNVIRILGHPGLLGPDNARYEFYAELFRYFYTHRSETPESLSEFYDWNLIDAHNDTVFDKNRIYWLGAK